MHISFDPCVNPGSACRQNIALCDISIEPYIISELVLQSVFSILYDICKYRKIDQNFNSFYMGGPMLFIMYGLTHAFYYKRVDPYIAY